MTKTRIRIATAATIVGLAGLGGWAISADRRQATQAVAEKPIVRTKVIRRTIHVTKHAEPVTTASSGSGSSEPVTTATSGAGGGGEEEHETSYEFEGGGEGGDD